jgi:hypothetical protein
MARLLVFSDLHSDVKALERLMEIEADYYFAAGDLVNWARGLEKMGDIMKPRASQMYVLPGNHESSDDIVRLCAEHGFTNFHGRSLVIENTGDGTGSIRVCGLGYSSPTPFATPGEYSEEEMAARLAPFAAVKPDVLICHAPPLNTPLDRIREGLHGGSNAVRDFINMHQPRYFFCGHIHEAAGTVLQLGATRAQNVGKQGYLLTV